jgi:phosphatidylglycerophosphate synthase
VSADAALYFSQPVDRDLALLSVAGRPVALRAVMAAVRAGAERVHVPASLRGTGLERAIEATPAARRRVAWLEPHTPRPGGALLLLPACGMVTADAVRALRAGGTPALVHSAAPAAPAVLLAPAAVASVWRVLAAGEPAGEALCRLPGVADRAPAPGHEGFEPVTSTADARRITKRLLASLGSAIDTPLDRALHRRLSGPVSLIAVRLGVTPNAVSLLSLAAGLAAALLLARGTVSAALAGFALYVVAVVLDHADGEVARLTFAESRIGEWLDVAVDTIVHALVVVAMGAAAQRAAGAGAVGGLLAGAGVVGSAWFVKASQATPDPAGGVLDALGNRHGFYAMLLLFVVSLAVLPAALPFLMLIVAAGTNAYWIGWLVSRVRAVRRPTRLRKPK